MRICVLEGSRYPVGSSTFYLVNNSPLLVPCSSFTIHFETPNLQVSPLVTGCLSPIVCAEHARQEDTIPMPRKTYGCSISHIFAPLGRTGGVKSMFGFALVLGLWFCFTHAS